MKEIELEQVFILIGVLVSHGIEDDDPVLIESARYIENVFDEDQLEDFRKTCKESGITLTGSY